MGTVRYTVIDGEIVSEVRDGVRRDYVPDSLGNTKALTDGTSFTDTWEYWPYGEVRTRTGTTATPFQFVGTLGYYTDSANSRIYVRARTYRQGLGRWQTVDPLWPMESAYRYVKCSPSSHSDPTGLVPNGQGTKFDRVDPCSCPIKPGFGPPTSNVGHVYISCNCLRASIRVLPEAGDVEISPRCGMWIPADAIRYGSVWMKIHGQTCLVIQCMGDNKVAVPTGICCSNLARCRGTCWPAPVTEPRSEFGDRGFGKNGPDIVLPPL